ncbi:hypothetical protein GCM10018954_080380 [Kutzneria kofuensis]
MAVALGVAAVVGIGLMVWSSVTTSTRATGTQRCLKPDEVDIYLHTDDELSQAQAKVRASHPDAESDTQTKQQSYEEFLQLFKDQPDVLRTARPEAMPAVVKVRPEPGASASALGDALAQEFPPPAEIHRLICSELQGSH